MISVAVLGAGSWGTALALVLAKNGVSTRLWSYKPAECRTLQMDRCNRRYLPDHPFPELLQPCMTLDETLAEIDNIFIVVPSHGFSQLFESLRPFIHAGTRLAWGTKGLSPGGQLLSELVRHTLGEKFPVSILSGPSFASEVASQKPTAITLASSDETHGAFWYQAFCTSYFRVYKSTDIVGVQLGGAVKNVLAIATGIADGMQLGANARAALITRGLSEMMRLGQILGADRHTLLGLAGVGDLILTCTDNQSRNRRFGLALGQGKSAEAAAADIKQVIEGANTVAQLHAIAQQCQLEMPITEQVYRILYAEGSVTESVTALLAREPGEE